MALRDSDEKKAAQGNDDSVEKPAQNIARQVVSGHNATGFNFGSFSGSFHQAPNPKIPDKPLEEPKPSAGPKVDVPCRLLFLAANPGETDRLRLDEEVRNLNGLLDSGPARGCMDLRPQWAVRISDLLPLLLRHRPHILHFSGHGRSAGGVILEKGDGDGVAVAGQQLAQLLGQFADTLRCVFLNACFSASQASEIAEAVDCVVGYSEGLEDNLAIQAAGSFYQSLAYGCSVQKAFDLTRANAALTRFVGSDRFQLVAKRCSPESVFFAG